MRGTGPRRGLAAVRGAGSGALLAVGRGVGDRAPSCLAVVRGAANVRCPARLFGVAGAFTVKGSKALEGFENVSYEGRRGQLGLLSLQKRRLRGDLISPTTP